ncbi:MAG TPA: membrane protein insertase YidC, partial [Gemmatimonadota bacterium]|nr:membrane protein insertase YidC [Gemmatimonadota bacterium]
QRRVLLAFLLMALVLVASQWWYGRMQPPADAGLPDTTGVVEEGAAPPGGDAGRIGTAPVDTASRAAVSADTTAAADTAAAPRDPNANELLAGGVAPSPVTVETPLYRMTLDPRGATIAQVELLRYESYQGEGSVRLVPEGAAFLGRAAEIGDRRIALDSLTFQPGDSALVLEAGDAPREIAFTHVAAGRRITQSYRFDPADYVVDYRLDIGGAGDGVLVTGVGPRLETNEKNPREDYGQLRAVARLDGEIVSFDAGDVDEERVARGGAVDWAGLKNKYFLAVLLAPPEGMLSAVEVGGAADDSLPRVEVAVRSPLRSGSGAYRLYLGPQEYRRLAALNDGLDDVNQYGWSWIRWMITPFAKAIVVAMLWLHRFIPDYGLVLIVFGVLVRLVMWPLTTKSFRSIQAMQKIQPEIQRLRERYKNDPQRMQQETMRLYKEKKVNPLGGCLPNLIPMPILFALFFVFQGTIEFRGQPFLWLPDLSQPDPWYILPLLMGLTMFISSKLTQTDPKMAAMTYVMPVVLTFVFLNLAAGLVLYYTVSNVLTFVQQWMLRRGTESPAAVQPAEG